MKKDKSTFSQRGFNKEDYFRVLANDTEKAIEVNSIVKLYRDDGTDKPLFKVLTGYSKYHLCDGEMGAFVEVDALEWIPPEVARDILGMKYDSSTKESVLDEAKRIIYGDREKTYGDPGKNLRHIADQWTLYLKQKYGSDLQLTAEDVCYMMVDLKKCRQINSNKRDNQVDAIGYLALIERL